MMLFDSPRAPADETKRARGNWESVSFRTADGVKLRGYFYPGPKGGKSPTVMLIHDIGDDPNSDGWRDLAADLQFEAKAAVLVLGLRGHGSSTQVNEVFWQVPPNRYAAARVSLRNPPEEIRVDDFQRGYHPMLVNDLAAARRFLDQRNDSHECNSRRLILVGEGQGAALGTAWLGLESRRYRVVNQFAGLRDRVPESGDVFAVVWLNPKSAVGGKKVAVADWLRAVNAAKPVRLGVINDPDDSAAAGAAKGCESAYTKTKTKTKNWFATATITAAETRNTQLAEVESVREKVCNYVVNRLGDDPPGWEEREYDDHRYVWATRSGVVLAKLEGERALRLISPDWVTRP